MKCIRINSNGTMNDINLSLKKKGLSKLLEEICISKGNTDFKELYKWIHKEITIFCYGWYDGDPGFENKHDLIPNGNSDFLEEDSSKKLLFGDIILFAMKKNKFINFSVTDYSEIYEILFDFDDCEDITDDEDESEEENGFIVDDDKNDDEDEDFNSEEEEESEDSYEYLSDDDLDIDENDYSDESD